MIICLGCGNETHGKCCGTLYDLSQVLGESVQKRNSHEVRRTIEDDIYPGNDSLFPPYDGFFDYGSDDESYNSDDMVSTDVAYNLPIEERLIKGFEFLGTLPKKKYRLVVHGTAGHGKSTFCLMFANAISNSRSKTIYWCVEEGAKSVTMLKKIQSIGIRNKNLILLHTMDENEVIEKLKRTRAKNIVIDSVNRGSVSHDFIIELHEHLQGGVVSVLHSTKDGKAKGGTEHSHECDVEIRVHDGVARTIKNRCGELSSYEIFQKAYKGNGQNNGTSRASRSRWKGFEILPD